MPGLRWGDTSVLRVAVARSETSGPSGFVNSHVEAAIRSFGGHHRRRFGRCGPGRTTGIQQADAVDLGIEHLMGVARHADRRTVARLLADDAGHAPLVALEVAGAVSDDELDAAALDRRHRREIEMWVHVPGDGGQLPAGEIADLLERVGRVEIPDVDGVIGRFDFLADPLGDFIRARGDVGVADDRNSWHRFGSFAIGKTHCILVIMPGPTGIARYSHR